MSVEWPPYEVIVRSWPFIYHFWNDLGRLGGELAHRQIPVNATSYYRDPESNRRANGHPSSQHLAGLAVDVVGDLEAITEIARTLGMQVVRYRTHVHIQYFPPGVAGTLGLTA